MKASEITVDWLTGKAETKMEVFSSVKLHPETSPAFKKLQEKAKKAGFDLQIVSGFRSFDSQLKIWNQKVKGDRPVFDLKGNKIDPNSLPAEKLIHTILRWSALPGCSRHHWGTDIDVIDRGAISADYKVQLTPEEVNPGGPFCKLHDWLDDHMHEEGFFRPYERDLGGVSPERWHLSYAPIAEKLFLAHREAYVKEAIESSSIELKQNVVSALASIFRKYFLTICPPKYPLLG